ncbi:MAG: ABC transporter substrate-binding protein [Lachnospiraceae bacterium]|nr:ABC transporter substrate-binding protein [Lachnospiraceae bacterium]
MKRRIFSLVLVVLMTAALCGCKGGTDKDGGTIVVGITQDMDSLDPHKAVAAGTKEVLYNIFEGLVKSDEKGDLVPAVAKSYTISEDGLTYSFELRDNVRFHNGDKVTAEDIVYSLKRCAGMLETTDPEVQVISAFSVIKEIKADETKVEVVLDSPNTELIGYFTCAIIPENYTDQTTAPIGTGPFRFVSYTPQVSVVIEKNNKYYLDGVPSLDGVTFKISASSDAAFLELLGGSIDVFPYVTDEQSKQLKDKFDILAAPMNLVQGLFLNNKVKPFDDVRVRQALNMAVNRDEIISMVAGGRSDVVESAIFSSYKTYYNESLSSFYTYDPDRAKALLEEAGYGDGFSFKIKVPSNYVFHIDTAQVIVEELKKIGVDAQIELIEWATWLSDVYSGRDFEATVIGLDAKLAPGDTLKYYPSDSSKNFINFSDPEFDELYKKAVNEVDTDKKATAYKRLQEILTEQAASVFIQSPHNVVAVSKRVEGYVFYPVYVQDMSTIRIKAPEADDLLPLTGRDGN